MPKALPSFSCLFIRTNGHMTSLLGLVNVKAEAKGTHASPNRCTLTRRIDNVPVAPSISSVMGNDWLQHCMRSGSPPWILKSVGMFRVKRLVVTTGNFTAAAVGHAPPWIALQPGHLS